MLRSKFKTKKNALNLLTFWFPWLSRAKAKCFLQNKTLLCTCLFKSRRSKKKHLNMSHYNEEGWRKAIRKGNYQETLVAMKSLKAKHKNLNRRWSGLDRLRVSRTTALHIDTPRTSHVLSFFFFFLYYVNEKSSNKYIFFEYLPYELRNEIRNVGISSRGQTLSYADHSESCTILENKCSRSCRVSWSAKKWQIALETQDRAIIKCIHAKANLIFLLPIKNYFSRMRKASTQNRNELLVLYLKWIVKSHKLVNFFMKWKSSALWTDAIIQEPKATWEKFVSLKSFFFHFLWFATQRCTHENM